MAKKISEHDALKGIDLFLEPLSPEERQRIFDWIAMKYKIGRNTKSEDIGKIYSNNPREVVSFSEDRSMSPKIFLREKSPQMDTERIACLAYYLTHYRDLPHFKTIDLSTLNTEAAQPKFSNPTVAVDNATKAGLLAQAGKGNKQISAAGELFVQALPDREAAKASIANRRTRRRSKKVIFKSAKPSK